jgi:tetratricopeptide (TPR) repeat protein
MILPSIQYFFTSLFDFHLDESQELIAIVLYVFICLLTLYVIKIILSKYIQKISWAFYFLPLLISLFVPVLGLFISLFIVLAIINLHSKFYEHTEQIDDSINLKEVNFEREQYGSGGAFLNLMKKSASPLARTNALFVLAQGQLTNINSMLHELLPDSSDEIRLLSFNILDQQEGFIQEDINKIESLIKTSELDPLHYAKCEKNLALLYWELSYRHLILKELEQATLQKAQIYAQSALKVLHDDAKTWSLLGKIHYRLKEYSLAEEALKKAMDLAIPPSQVLPYLAELKYKTKNYAAVRYYLSSSDTLYDIAIIAPVKRFWGKK